MAGSVELLEDLLFQREVLHAQFVQIRRARAFHLERGGVSVVGLENGKLPLPEWFLLGFFV